MARHTWTASRRFVAGTAAALATIVWTHGLAALLRPLGPEDAPLAAVHLTVAAFLAAALGTARLPRRDAESLACGLGLAGAAVIELLASGAGSTALALAPAAAAAVSGARWLGRRLPAAPGRHRVAAVVWALVAVVAVVQVGRLAVAVTDTSKPLYLTTDHPFWFGHECIGAYLYGAEMSARGEPDLYDPKHYPGLNREAEPQSRLEGVALDDPYQYPPQFLLLPRAALALTWDVEVVRVVWFALQASLFVAVAAALALFVGGRAGRTALWLLPAVLASFPVLHNLQFGQMHLPAVAVAVAAVLAVERRRPATGGALLALAILTKVFPAVLLPWLAVRRQWKALAACAATGAVVSLLALAVLGPAPFIAFVDNHLPRLADGSAFAFDEAWPELTELIVVDNQGAFGLARKLGAGPSAAATVNRIFGLAVLLAAAAVGLRRRTTPTARLATGLALLGLASLASPGAWGDYVPATAVWLLSLLAADLWRTVAGRVALLLAVPFQALLLGTMPIGSWAPIPLMVPLSAVGAAGLLLLFAGVVAAPTVLADRRASAAAEPALPALRRAA